MRRLVPALLAAALIMAPLNTQAADLVVWWEKGIYAQEDEAVREIMAAFEQGSGKQVELAFYAQRELGPQIEAALEAGQPPDFAFGTLLLDYIGEWAFDDRLLDLTDTIGPLSNLFDPDALRSVTWLNAKTGQKALYGLPMGQYRQYIHVWKNLLEEAGSTLADIPKEWDPFWSFWCDQVQPAVRKALGRDDIWGVGISMSADSADTSNQFDRFMAAYEAEYVMPDGRLVIDDPEVRRRLIKAIDSYTAIYRKGCTPPDSIALPAMPKLLEAPFWLDPSDPHRMAAVMQASTRPMQYDYATVTGDWRHDLAFREEPWAKAVHRIVADGISPEQAVDEAIARIKQILSE